MGLTTVLASAPIKMIWFYHHEPVIDLSHSRRDHYCK